MDGALARLLTAPGPVQGQLRCHRSRQPRFPDQAAGIPLVVLAGKEYGSGSSRDWAAKGTALL
ncbi:hypothetical protein ABZ760_25635, partial [Streptomyces sp. NPDC006658]|uniref:hypothetical protein n=1 Tax=Streptomyces sp. NPDC006658 TaxID=3156900 RepID=UPI0033D1C599